MKSYSLNPDRFGKWLKKNRLHASFNVHPFYIPPKDSRLPLYLKKAEVQKKFLAKKESPHRFHAGHQIINLLNRKEAEAYFNVFHKPIEKQGCHLWWVDGVFPDQKGRETNTWLNHLYARYGTGFIFSRGYGLGTHRDTIQFTGDTYSQWSVLEEEVVITQKASNFLLAYISHDIGAFHSGNNKWKNNQPPDDLYIRWVQFGCLSPVMRFHSNHGIREPWRFKKETLRITKQFLLFRKALLPYFKELVKIAHETGVGLCQPMYYEFPEFEESYQYDKQYMLGDSFLISPVVSEDSYVETWFPEGSWYHCFTERTVKGPAVIKEKVPMDIMPVYAREGHPIPFKLENKTRLYNPCVIPLAFIIGII